MPVRLVVVTPNQLLGDSLRRALNSAGEFEVVGMYHDIGQTAIVAARDADIVVVDARFPDPPIDFIAQVHEQFPDARIVVVQAPEFPQHVLPFIEAGAVGHVEGSRSFRELVGILRTVHSGGAVIDPALANLVIQQMIQLSTELGSPFGAADAQHELTEREMEVLAEAATGKSNAEIGETLFIQEGTVKNHIHNILRKLDLRDRGQAALWYGQWQRMQRSQQDEGEEEETKPQMLAPAEFMQDFNTLAHPRGMIFAAAATAHVRSGVERALQVLCDRLDWPIGHVFLLDESIGALGSSGIWSLPTPQSFPELQIAVAGLNIPVDDEIGGISIREGDPMYVTDIQQEPDSILAGLTDARIIRSVLLVPLRSDDVVIGAMVFFSTDIEDEPTGDVYEGLQQAGERVTDFIEEPVAIADLPRPSKPRS